MRHEPGPHALAPGRRRPLAPGRSRAFVFGRRRPLAPGRSHALASGRRRALCPRALAPRRRVRLHTRPYVDLRRVAGALCRR